MPSYWFNDVEIQVQRRRDVDPKDQPLPRDYAGFIQYPSNHAGLFDWDNFADGELIVGGLLAHIPFTDGDLRYVGPLYDAHRFRVLPNGDDMKVMVDRCVQAVIALDSGAPVLSGLPGGRPCQARSDRAGICRRLHETLGRPASCGGAALSSLSMNEQKAPGGIEWTRIRYVNGLFMRGWTWNPTTGCKHGCTWLMPDGSIAQCYAKTIAEEITPQLYPKGFEHHYWHPERLYAPLKVKEPGGVFVGSMADLFGGWVPPAQIAQVVDVMRQAHWHTFQVLTKYPANLGQYQFSDNVWLGTSLPSRERLPKRVRGLSWDEYSDRMAASFLDQLARLRLHLNNIRFVSFEPLWGDVAEPLQRWLDNRYSGSGKCQLPFEWAIIGAASNRRQTFQPKPEWVENLLALLDQFEIPVFFKGNLDWQPQRLEFPPVQPPVTQKALL